MFGLSELAIILIVVIAVLAAKKLPELARSAGKSARILKAEAKAANDGRPTAQPRVIRGETITRQDASAAPDAGHRPATPPADGKPERH
ncbi:twin-arginine translocase TatA/TatE family subunit [Streptomyces sp. NPDC004457]|uniref:twin-arginine translocase TatA/TatE family subunit n=1 Tax=Streptomyces spinosus TaxID=2872623 RepID=UPI001CED1762|nr:twin-arginine translocase TatA/TatE family subunit [Streptomyces spinosus]